MNPGPRLSPDTKPAAAASILDFGLQPWEQFLLFTHLPVCGAPFRQPEQPEMLGASGVCFSARSPLNWPRTSLQARCPQHSRQEVAWEGPRPGSLTALILDLGKVPALLWAPLPYLSGEEGGSVVWEPFQQADSVPPALATWLLVAGWERTFRERPFCSSSSRPSLTRGLPDLSFLFAPISRSSSLQVTSLPFS